MGYDLDSAVFYILPTKHQVVKAVKMKREELEAEILILNLAVRQLGAELSQVGIHAAKKAMPALSNIVSKLEKLEEEAKKLDAVPKIEELIQ